MGVGADRIGAFPECLAMIGALDDVDLFVSRAAAEVVRMCKQELKLACAARILRDTAASAPPVGGFYYGVYHTLVLAPANTVAKCVLGISDTLVTNVPARAGRCRVPAIVFACDTAPELATEAGMVRVFPRRVDLEHTARLKTLEAADVVGTLEAPGAALARRKNELAAHG